MLLLPTLQILCTMMINMLKWAPQEILLLHSSLPLTAQPLLSIRTSIFIFYIYIFYIFYIFLYFYIFFYIYLFLFSIQRIGLDLVYLIIINKLLINKKLQFY